MRTVVSPQVGESETLYTRTGELRLRMDHGNLLVECHPTECIVDTLLHRYRLIEILGQLLSLCAGSDHQCYDYTLNFQH